MSRTVSIWDERNQVRPLSDVMSAIQGREILLVTHGFSVDQFGGEANLAGWASGLTLGDVVVLGILWPGDSRWIPKIDYVIEGNEAMASGDLLADFINRNFAGALSLSFASHSLGARMILQTISGLSRDVRTLLLMAGAIDNTCLSSEYSRATGKIKNISILASREDEVLKWAFPAGNFVGGLLTRGTPYVHEALGREGPGAPYSSNLLPGWQIEDIWQFGHGDYLPGAQLVPIPPVANLLGPVPAVKAAWSAAFMSGRF